MLFLKLLNYIFLHSTIVNKYMLKKYFISLFLVSLLSSCGFKQKQNTSSNLQLAQATQADQSESDMSTIVSKQAKDMSFQEALRARDYYQEQNDTSMMIKCAQRMLAVGGDQETMRKTNLQLAQVFLDEGKFDKAQKHALDYQTLYPGTPESKLAHYINIKANFLSTLSADRDQTKTEKAIELAQNFVTKYSTDTEYKSSVNDMLEVCYRKLLTREINIINSYLSKYNYYKVNGPLIAAYNRLGYIKSKLLPYVKCEAELITQVELAIAKAASETPEVLKAIQSATQTTLLAQAEQVKKTNNITEKF